MGRVTEMLPQIEADIRAWVHMQSIAAWTGCWRLDCTLEMQEDVLRFGTWVRHNQETRFFEERARRHRHDGMVIAPRPGTPELTEAMPLMPLEMAEWITALHRAIEETCAAEQEAVLVADPWAEHALMVSGR